MEACCGSQRSSRSRSCLPEVLYGLSEGNQFIYQPYRKSRGSGWLGVGFFSCLLNAAEYYARNLDRSTLLHYDSVVPTGLIELLGGNVHYNGLRPTVFHLASDLIGAKTEELSSILSAVTGHDSRFSNLAEWDAAQEFPLYPAWDYAGRFVPRVMGDHWLPNYRPSWAVDTALRMLENSPSAGPLYLRLIAGITEVA
mgnify:CR=1 FL=1